jgi:hypothetical protein
MRTIIAFICFSYALCERFNTFVPSKLFSWEIDVDATLKTRAFKMSPQQLIARTKNLIDKGFLLSPKEEDIADDFVFQFPIVGPLTKKRFLKDLRGFNLLDAFPDAQSYFYNFHVDPFEPNRVWFATVFRATHTGGMFSSQSI